MRYHTITAKVPDAWAFEEDLAKILDSSPEIAADCDGCDARTKHTIEFICLTAEADRAQAQFARACAAVGQQASEIAISAEEDSPDVMSLPGAISIPTPLVKLRVPAGDALRGYGITEVHVHSFEPFVVVLRFGTHDWQVREWRPNGRFHYFYQGSSPAQWDGAFIAAQGTPDGAVPSPMETALAMLLADGAGAKFFAVRGLSPLRERALQNLR